MKDYHNYVWRIRQKSLNSERGVESDKEHEGILNAIKNKDEMLAEKLATEHVLNAYKNIEKNNMFNIYNDLTEK